MLPELASGDWIALIVMVIGFGAMSCRDAGQWRPIWWSWERDQREMIQSSRKDDG